MRERGWCDGCYQIFVGRCIIDRVVHSRFRFRQSWCLGEAERSSFLGDLFKNKKSEGRA